MSEQELKAAMERIGASLMRAIKRELYIYPERTALRERQAAITETARRSREEAAVNDDAKKVDCPQTCSHRGREHVHLEAPDGCGQIWGVGDDGQPTILDPFDLERTAVQILPAPTRRRR